MGCRLPDFLDVKVLEETADTTYLVLPHLVGEGDEPYDADLDAVCGGSGRSKWAGRRGAGGGGGGGDGGAGGDGGDGGDAGYQCQTYGAGNMGTHNEIDTETSVF